MNPTTFQAGFAKVDITPRVGVPLAGFGPYLNRNSTEVRAPLFARLALFKKGEEVAVILSLEVCGLTRQLEQRLRSLLVEEGGIAEDALLISTTHTHSGPQTVGHIGWGYSDDLYNETLPFRILPALEAARQNLQPVEVSFSEPECVGLAINRELDSAYERDKPVEHFLDPSWRPEKPQFTDTRCQVLVFRTAEKVVGIVHSFGCHPVVCCERNTQISGDFVGLACQEQEKAHAGAISLFLPGALGDVNPSISHRPEKESLRALDIISQRYFQFLEAGLETAQPLEDPVLRCRLSRVTFPRVDWDLDTVRSHIRKMEEKLHQPGLTDDPLVDHGHPLERNGMYMVRLVGLRKLKARMEAKEELNPPSPLHGIRLGPILLLGGAFEIYQSSKNEIRSALSEAPVLVLSLVNGAEGYAPDPESYERNGYSAEFVPLMKGDPPHRCLHETLIQALVEIGNSLRD